MENSKVAYHSHIVSLILPAIWQKNCRTAQSIILGDWMSGPASWVIRVWGNPRATNDLESSAVETYRFTTKKLSKTCFAECSPGQTDGKAYFEEAPDVSETE